MSNPPFPPLPRAIGTARKIHGEAEDETFPHDAEPIGLRLSDWVDQSQVFP